MWNEATTALKRAQTDVDALLKYIPGKSYFADFAEALGVTRERFVELLALELAKDASTTVQLELVERLEEWLGPRKLPITP